MEQPVTLLVCCEKETVRFTSRKQYIYIKKKKLFFQLFQMLYSGSKMHLFSQQLPDLHMHSACHPLTEGEAASEILNVFMRSAIMSLQ